MAPRGPRSSLSAGAFKGETFDAFVHDMQSGRIPLERIVVSDNIQVGLRAIIRKSGQVAFHVQYSIVDGGKDGRPYLKIGEHPNMSVAQARKLASTITSLAARGIDVQEGLRKRLIRELIEKGDKWRP